MDRRRNARKYQKSTAVKKYKRRHERKRKKFSRVFAALMLTVIMLGVFNSALILVTDAVETTTTSPTNPVKLNLVDLDFSQPNPDVKDKSVNWSRTPADNGYYYPSSFTLMLNASSAGRTSGWQVGDSIELPDIKYQVGDNIKNVKFNLTKRELTNIGTLEGNRLTFNVADTGQELKIEVKDIGASEIDFTGLTALTDQSNVVGDLLSVQKSFTGPKAAVQKAMMRAAAATSQYVSKYWTPQAGVSPTTNMGNYGNIDNQELINSNDPFDLNSAATDSPQQVTVKGIFGKSTTGGVKWYIDANGVLHLGPGTTSSPINGSVSSPWISYSSFINAISIDGVITLDANSAYLFQGLENVTSIVGGEKLNFSNVVTGDKMFQGMTQLKQISGSANWNTILLKSASQMFASTGLTSLDVSGWNTVALNSMASMFSGSTSLAEITGISNINTSALTNIYSTFNGTALTSLDLSKWNVSKITSLGYTFTKMTKLTSLNVSNWDTSQVTSIRGVFQGSSSLKTLDISSWNTSHVSDYAAAFSIMGSLKIITIGPEFKVPQATSVALPNTAANVLWKPVETGTISKPAGVGVGSFTSDSKADTYVLSSATSSIVDATVKGSDGKILSGVSVALYDASGKTQIGSTQVSDSKGQVAFTDVPINTTYIVKQLSTVDGYTIAANQTLSITPTSNNHVDLINEITTPPGPDIDLPLTGSKDQLYLYLGLAATLLVGITSVVIHEVRRNKRYIKELLE